MKLPAQGSVPGQPTWRLFSVGSVQPGSSCLYDGDTTAEESLSVRDGLFLCHTLIAAQSTAGDSWQG